MSGVIKLRMCRVRNDAICVDYVSLLSFVVLKKTGLTRSNFNLATGFSFSFRFPFPLSLAFAPPNPSLIVLPIKPKLKVLVSSLS